MKDDTLIQLNYVACWASMKKYKNHCHVCFRTIFDTEHWTHNTFECSISKIWTSHWTIKFEKSIHIKYAILLNICKNFYYFKYFTERSEEKLVFWALDIPIVHKSTSYYPTKMHWLLQGIEDSFQYKSLNTQKVKIFLHFPRKYFLQSLRWLGFCATHLDSK